MRRIWRRVVVGLCLLGAVAALAACTAEVSFDDDSRPVSTDVDDFTFQSLDVVYDLSRADDGTSRLRVTETFVAEFPEYDQNHGMRRLIPDTYNGQPLFPALVSITDAAGRPRAEEAEGDDGVYAMTSRADEFVHGEQTYVFTYDLQNVTWNFADTGVDEFYWDVNGVDWAQSFGRVTATLRVAPDLADALTGDPACYVGAHGSEEACEISAADDGVAAQATDLQPYETMTIAVGFRRGTFAAFDSRYLASGWSWLQLSGALIVLVALAWTIAVRARTLRNAPGRRTIIAEYTPPGIDALESAVFLGRSAKAIPAEVLEQAVAGSIRIEEGPRSIFGRTTLRAVLLDPERADADGRLLLDGLFGPDAPEGAEFTFGTTDSALAAASRQILAEAAGALAARGFYRTVPRRVRVWPGLLLVAGAILAVGGGILAIESGADAGIPILLLLLPIPALVVFFFLIGHKPLSAGGAELGDHLRGLKEFIHWAEADRIRMLQSPRGAERIDTGDASQLLRIYEPLLSYAVVFGQEKEWAERLAVLYGDGVSPPWYVGTAAFTAASFTSGIGALSTSAASSSSTSGGSGGGGSAGGGGGGGGGGGV